MRTKPPPIPAHLGEAGRKLYRRIAADFELEPHHLAILDTACHALDTAEACRVRLTAEGLTITGPKGAMLVHPLLAAERAARRQCLQALRQLGLDEEMAQPRDERGRFDAPSLRVVNR